MAIQYGDGTSSDVGRVIKVQSAIYYGNQTFSTSSYVDVGTNLGITVTPESTNSRFWLLFSGTAQVNGLRARFDIFDNVRNNYLSGRSSLSAIENGPHVNTMITMQCFDEPNSTSTRTYQPKVKNDGVHQVYINAGTNITSFVVVEFAD
tara:strand:- start:289 stop:735 length:447 start_codon:yes stop_codon:yes gene_type:complete